MSKFLHHKLLLSVVIAALLAILPIGAPALAARACTERFYLSPIIGTGAENDPVRPLIADLLQAQQPRDWSWAAVYGPTDPITARPISWWAFVSVSTSNHNFLTRSDELGALPDVDPATLLTDLKKKDLSDLSEILIQFEIDPSILDTATTYQDVLNFIGYSLAGADFVMPHSSCQ